MKTAKYYNQFFFAKENKNVKEYNGLIKLYYGAAEVCMKLGVGRVYDDHCASSWVLEKVEYEDILAEDGKGIEVVSDLDKVVFKDKIKCEVYVQGMNGAVDKTFLMDKEDLEALFVIQAHIYDNGYVGTVTHIPEFSNLGLGGGYITANFLRKLWNIPASYEWFQEGDFEVGLEPNVELKLGLRKRVYYFMDQDKIKKEIIEKENKILEADKYEKWMDEFINTFMVNKEVKEKYYKLLYETNPSKYDQEVKEAIEAIKDIKNSLYNLSAHEKDIPYISLNKVHQQSPLYSEYLEVAKDFDDLCTTSVELGRAGTYYFIRNRNDNIWNIKVPDELKGLFIGKGGKNIKRLKEHYGVKRINVL